MSAPTSPAAGADRLEVVDALRGFALFGVFWANLLIFAGIGYMAGEQRAARFPGALDRAAYLLERFFVENKFIGLFSVLFGISFWLFVSRAGASGRGGTARFYRRVAWLFVIGAVHGALWWGDVLRFYALWALLLPLFARVAPGRLLAIALSVGVLAPALVAGARAWSPAPAPATADFDALVLAAFSEGDSGEMMAANLRYDAYLTFSWGHVAYELAVFGRLLLGLYVARTLPLGSLAASRSLLWRVVLVGVPVGAIGSTVFALLPRIRDDAPLVFARRLVIEAGQFGLTLAYAAGLVLVFLSPRWGRAARGLAPIGRMALTWYLSQTMFGLWMFYGFTGGPALMGDVGPAALLALAVLGFGLQLVLARLWLGHFRFGPAEWLWRTLTYGKRQRLRVSLAASLAVTLLTAAHPAGGAGRVLPAGHCGRSSRRDATISGPVHERSLAWTTRRHADLPDRPEVVRKVGHASDHAGQLDVADLTT
jgi:uncharacterized protein